MAYIFRNEDTEQMADNANDNNGGDAIDERRERLRRVRRRLNFDQEPVFSNSDEISGEFVLEDAEASLSPVLSQEKDASAKWNFDFANEVPLEGVWEWERVERSNQQDFKELTIVREIKKGSENRSV